MTNSIFSKVEGLIDQNKKLKEALNILQRETKYLDIPVENPEGTEYSTHMIIQALGLLKGKEEEFGKEFFDCPIIGLEGQDITGNGQSPQAGQAQQQPNQRDNAPPGPTRSQYIPAQLLPPLQHSLPQPPAEAQVPQIQPSAEAQFIPVQQPIRQQYQMPQDYMEQQFNEPQVSYGMQHAYTQHPPLQQYLPVQGHPPAQYPPPQNYATPQYGMSPAYLDQQYDISPNDSSNNVGLDPFDDANLGLLSFDNPPAVPNQQMPPPPPPAAAAAATGPLDEFDGKSYAWLENPLVPAQQQQPAEPGSAANPIELSPAQPEQRAMSWSDLTITQIINNSQPFESTIGHALTDLGFY